MQDVIHVVESKSAKRYGDYFLRQILKVCNPFPPRSCCLSLQPSWDWNEQQLDILYFCLSPTNQFNLIALL